MGKLIHISHEFGFRTNSRNKCKYEIQGFPVFLFSVLLPLLITGAFEWIITLVETAGLVNLAAFTARIFTSYVLPDSKLSSWRMYSRVWDPGSSRHCPVYGEFCGPRRANWKKRTRYSIEINRLTISWSIFILFFEIHFTLNVVGFEK